MTLAWTKTLYLGVSLCTLAFSALAQSIVVTDGDTVKLNGTIYRLWGIDAPEMHQFCADGWPAGQEAAKAMRSLIEDREVYCEPRGSDRYGRTIGLCWADGTDIQAAMVSAGMAWAFVRYSRDYVQQESKAREAKRGIHNHDCVPAWEWRERHR